MDYHRPLLSTAADAAMSMQPSWQQQQPPQPPCDPLESFQCLVTHGYRHHRHSATRGGGDGDVRTETTMTFLADVLPPMEYDDNDAIRRLHRVDALLQRYWKPNDGFSGGAYKEQQHAQQQNALTYGEVTPLGCRQLARAMGITSTATTTKTKKNGKNDSKHEDEDQDHAPVVISSEDGISVITFVDLGSGVGRLATQLYLDHPHIIHKAVGVELSQERHDIGMAALQGLMLDEDLRRMVYHDGDGDDYYHFGDDDDDLLWTQHSSSFYPNDHANGELPPAHDHDVQEDSSSSSSSSFEKNDDDRPRSSSTLAAAATAIELIQGDAVDYLKQQSTTNNITHVYMSSLCFPDDVLLQLQEALLQLPSLQVVAALNRLNLFWQKRRRRQPSKGDGDEWHEVEVPIQMSWGPGVVKVYHRRSSIQHDVA